MAATRESAISSTPAAGEQVTRATRVPQSRRGAPRRAAPGRGIEAYLKQVSGAGPLDLVELERAGVAAGLVAGLARALDLPTARLQAMLRIPRATAARQTAAGGRVTGRAGQAALGVCRLLVQARALGAHSTAPAARDFDVSRWLGRWLERPQPALGGRPAAELLDTPTGYALVARLLGALESGAYQ